MKSRHLKTRQRISKDFQDERVELVARLKWMNKIRNTISFSIFIPTALVGSIFLFSSDRADVILFLNKDVLIPLFIIEFIELFINKPFSFILKRLKNLFPFGIIQATLDIFLISALVHYLGGIEFPISVVVYCFGIAFIALVLQKNVGYWLAALSSVLYGFMILWEYYGWIPHITTTGWQPDLAVTINIVVFSSITFFLMAYFGADSADMVRRKAKELGDAFGKLKQSNERQRQLFDELEKSGERYRNMVENANDLVLSLDLDWKILSVNSAVKKIMGYDISEILQTNLVDYLSPESMKIARHEMEKRERGAPGKQTLLHLEVIRKDGAGKILEGQWQVFKKGRDDTEIQVIARDITERLIHEKALGESEEKYRSILENIEDGYYETDLAGSFTFFNDSLCKILGYPEDELMGMNNREYMDQENAKKVYQAFKRVHTTGGSTRIIDWEIIRKDGSKRHIEASGSLITDIEGKGIGFRGIMRDVTERKQTEVELIRTRNFLQNILDSSIFGITTTDIKGRITYTTPKVMDMLGYKQKEIIDKGISAFYGREKEDAGEIMKGLMTKGELRDHEIKLLNKDGDLIDFNLSASLLRNEKDEVIGTLGIYRDISEKKILEAQLLHAQKMESVGILAGGIAHDFNNILQAISGYVQLLLMKKEAGDPDHNYLNQIEKSTQRAADLIKQLLIFSRKVESKLMPVDLNREVEQVYKLLGRTLPRMIDIELRLSGDLDIINADPMQLEQIMMNLGVNARDAMPDGGKLIFETENIILGEEYCKVHMGSLPGEYVLLSISDSGHGMDNETVAHIFEPFFTTKETGKGTGLGLAMVYGIVKSHQGYITCYSELDNGTAFKIYFPALKVDAIEEGDKSEEEERIHGGNETILLVDDEKNILDIGKDMLSRYGYTAITAESGERALEVYGKEKDRIELVILDMGMPGMGGHKCLKEILGIDPGVKVIIASGYPADGHVKETLESGAVGFIGKPYRLKDMLKKVREALEV